MTSMLEFMNTVQNNKVATYSPVNTCNTSVNKPIAKEQSAQISTPKQDTFEKKDKKKITKKATIGTGVLAVAYIAFALIKYRKKSGGFLPKLVEPYNVLKARLNPNGFKPTVTIEENDMGYLGEVSTHLSRLKKTQKAKYIKNLYETTDFTEQGKNKFIGWYGEYLR